MLTRQLGKTNMEITPIGLGAWAIGGSWSGGWGPQDDDESVKTVHRALELGINWVDTAPVYGLGHSEEVVGRAIKESNYKPYVFTKCSLVWNDKGEVVNNLSSASLQSECEASLKRLGVETIDLYQVHWPNPDRDIEEGWSTLAKLKQEGKLRAIGVSNFSVEQMKRAQKIAPIDTLQPPYSLLRRDVENEILPFCSQNNIGVIVYSPMASGLLTGAMSKERIEGLADDDWRKHASEFQGSKLASNLALQNLLTEIGYPHNVSAGVVAVAWTLHNPAVTAAIVGSRHPAQIEDIIMAGEFRLSDSEMGQIQKFLAEQL
jgi:aryl-alcohol dehydrogenase-like predicted oxidoreductase